MRGVLRFLGGNRKAACGLFLVGAIVLMALAAPLLTPHAPDKRVGRPHQPPSATHLMGTTRMGHDVFTQLLYGGRTSLAVGFGAGILITVLGTAIGLTGGYMRGRVDAATNFATNVALVLPQLPLLLVLAAFMGQASPWVIALILAATSWAWGARMTRAQTLALREKEFVRAAELIGEPRHRILLVEILPNLTSIVGINLIGSIIFAVITEATLEFLGLGDPLAVSWGVMLHNAQNASALTVGAWWEVVAPCTALALLGAGLSLLNFAVDEIANPQLRTGRAMSRWRQLRRLRGVRA